MKHPLYKYAFAAVCGTLLFSISAASHAHFLWLKSIDEGGQRQAFLFFGEDPADEAYHLPERLAKTDVWRRTPDRERAKLEMQSLETDERIGRLAPIDDRAPCVLEAAQAYGIYGRGLLVYYAKHVHAKSRAELNTAGRSQELKLDVVPKIDGNQVRLTVFWNGKTLPAAEVAVSLDGAERITQTADDDGRVSLPCEGAAFVSVLVNHSQKDVRGDHDGKEYEGVLHYASLTFRVPDAAPKTDATTSSASSRAALPPLPEPLASFGAAIADGWLYAYSGHIGGEHEHSAANLSQHFRRIHLDKPNADWEELPMQTPLQGLALVSHGGKLYRMGGMNARNPTIDDEEDLHSVDEFAEYDPAKGQWRSLTPLPQPRSSHDAVVIGDRLYVVGGWTLTGSSPGEWQEDALVFDFADPRAGWQKLPQPFARRALAVSHWQNRIVAIGGLDESGEISRSVDVYDPATGEWSHGPDLPEARMAGFGGTACHLDGRLYVSGLGGIVYRLSETGSAWEEAARMARSRFFHQLLPAGKNTLLALGGASREGHIADLELIRVR